MKTITYRGEQYEVPEWAEYVAMDANGEISAYYSQERIEWVGLNPMDWRNSLEKV